MAALRTMIDGRHRLMVTIGMVAWLLAMVVTELDGAVRGNYLGCFADPKNVMSVMAFKEGSAESCVDRCEERYFR